MNCLKKSTPLENNEDNMNMDVSGLDYMNWLNSNVSAVEKELDEK